MKTSPPLSVFSCSLCTGLFVMCFALLLHPTSPEDFLALCLTNPRATWENPYGIQATVLFWIGAVPAAAGLAGMLHRTAQAVHKMIAATRDPRPAAVLREGWSS